MFTKKKVFQDPVPGTSGDRKLKLLSAVQNTPYLYTFEVNVHWQLGKAALRNLRGCEVGLDSAASS